MKTIQINQKASAFLLAFLLGMTTLSLGMMALADDTTVLIEDNGDDVFIIDSHDWERIVNETGEPSNFEELQQLIDNLEDEAWGPSATPDCIDILSIELEIGDPNATITFTMDGNVRDCHHVTILLLSNCTGDGNLALGMGSWTGAEGNLTNFYMGQGEDEVPIQGNLEGSTVEFEFPAENVEIKDDCCMFAIAYSIYGDGDLVRWDTAHNCDPECESCDSDSVQFQDH